MMHEIRLSIIIPFYNVEQYIAQCIDSVYQQDIPEEEYEVICVNDASPDGSREIVKEYQKKHKNLILVEHEVNKKLGAARNTGRRVAKGTYIWNVDSDDMIAPNCLKEILSVCESEELEILEVAYAKIKSGKIYASGAEAVKCHVQSGQQYLVEKYVNDIGAICPIWRKILKREFLDRNNIFSPEINMGEDEAFAMHVFAVSKRVAHINKDFYFYRLNDSSLTGNKKQMLKSDRMYEASILCPLAMCDVIRRVETHLNNEVYAAYYKMIQYEITNLWSDPDIEKQEKKEYWKKCSKNILKILPLFKYISRKSKIQLIVNILISILV